MTLKMFSYFCAGFFALAVLTHVNCQNQCPNDCICDGQASVICSDIERNVTWQGLWLQLSKVPTGVESLHISGRIDEVLGPVNVAFPELKVLYINDALMTSLKPLAFSHLPHLEKLNLAYNNISRINASHFAFLSSLTTLNLSNNELTSVHSDTFYNMTSLEVLDLSYNELSSIPTKLFSSLDQVKLVDISHNHLRYLHPNTFSALEELQLVHLEHNQLDTLHHATFSNTSLTGVWLAGNSWACHCGISWLVSAFSDENKNGMYVDKAALFCSSPLSLMHQAVTELDVADLACDQPEFGEVPQNVSIQYMHSLMLHCNVTSDLASLYWLTPHGVLVHPDHRRWIPPEFPHFHHRLTFAGAPSYHLASVEALANGSLAFDNFRLYFSGQYTCVAENPEGVATAYASVEIYSIIHAVMEYSTLLGYSIAIACLVFGIVSGSLRMCAERTCAKPKSKAASSVDQQNEQVPPEVFNDYWDDLMFQFEYDNRLRSPSLSPHMSPRKCVTPAEYDGDAPQHLTDDIKELLTLVRLRLRSGLESGTERVRTVTASLRDQSAHQVEFMRERASVIRQNMRDSTSHSLQRMRASSSQYASSVRTGVAMGLEQVKHHVQSMKELCGTTDMTGAQTVSVVSIETDVDTQETTEVVKAVTHV